MAELTSLRNIGKELERKLKAVEITTAEELKAVGSKEAFVRLKLRDPQVCLVHLYALEGAVTDREYNQLPEDVKRELKVVSDGLK
ncbi:MAG: TfoX/Sxy family protein [Oscillospiraceae bacterium]|nr:TfoX/Sxy family protein [Oscillospiraceae bacterium]